LNHFITNLRECWDSINSVWSKVSIAFQIIKILSPVLKNEAEHYFDSVRKIVQNNVINSIDSANLCFRVLVLTLRAFKGLMKQKIDTSQDIEDIEKLIVKFSSPHTQLQLWTDLASRYYIAGRTDDCRSLVNSQIRPMLKTLEKGNREELFDSIVTVAPVLYIAHSKTAYEQFSILPEIYQDLAYENISTLICTKTAPLDPVEAKDYKHFKLTYQEIVDLCELLEHMNSDSSIFYAINRISDIITSSEKTAFTIHHY